MSLLSVADRLNPSWKDDAAARHRQARAEREAAAQTLLAEAADMPQPLLALAEQEDRWQASAAHDIRATVQDEWEPEPGRRLFEAPAAPAREKAAHRDGLLSAVRRAFSRNPPEQPESIPGVQPRPDPASAGAQPTEHSMYPVHPDPNAVFAPQHQPAFFPQQPPFQQAAYAPSYPPQAPHHLQPMMPQQAQYPTQHPTQYPGQYPAPQMQPQFYAPAQPYPYAQQQMPYPQPYPWQMQPRPQPYPNPQPMPQGGPMAYAPQPPATPAGAPAQAVPMTASTEEPATIEEIRASLREFRDAVRELTESRSRRRYF